MRPAGKERFLDVSILQIKLVRKGANEAYRIVRAQIMSIALGAVA